MYRLDQLGAFPAGCVGREASYPAGRAGSASPDTPKTLYQNDSPANEHNRTGPDADAFPAVSRAAGKDTNQSEEKLRFFGVAERGSGVSVGRGGLL
jgi:hypothetical protein